MFHQKAVMENTESIWCKAPRRNWILLIYPCTLKCVFWLCDMTLPSMGDSPSFPLLISYNFSQFLQLEDSKLGISCPFLPLYLLGWSWSPAGGSIQFFSKTQLIVFQSRTWHIPNCMLPVDLCFLKTLLGPFICWWVLKCVSHIQCSLV